MTEGFHVPLIPFIDVAGKTGIVPPAHAVSEVPKLNVGVTIGFTVTTKLVESAQIPAAGVNVYVPEF